MQLLLIVHLFTTFAMCGLIWFVQIVHYPLFDRVGEDRFAEYEQANTRRTSLVVMPLMLAEIITAAALWWFERDAWFTANILVLAAIWLSTFSLQVPCHQRLSQGYAAKTVRRLVRTNWLRTLGWSVRTGGWLIWLLGGSAGSIH